VKYLSKIAYAFLILLFLLSSPASVFAQSPEDPNKEALESMINELQQTIEDADKRMVAHPRFLDELREMVKRYRAKLRNIYLFEDFADGDIIEDPKWSVVSGKFRITADSRLWSQVYVDASYQGSTSSSGETNPFAIILGEIAKAQEKKKTKKQGASSDESAVIQTMVAIGPAFEVDLTFTSDSSRGAMQIVLLGGTPARAYYRLVYHASPSPDRPIKIIRQRGSQQFIIDTATQYPNLDDGTPHQLQWIRDSAGNMRVLMDGIAVLNTVELYYKEEFSGLALANNGGTYEWGPIQVLQAPTAKIE
jgi:hypothetical protein